MNIKLTAGILIVMSFMLYACNSSESGKDADKYCDSVIVIQNRAITQLDSFFQSTRYRNYSTTEFYKKAQDETIRQIEALKKLGNFHEDNTLHIALLHVLTVTDQVLKEEGKAILELDEQLLIKYDKQKVDQLDSIENSAILKIQAAQLFFDSVQVQFLTQYGFDVVADSTQYTVKPDLE